MKKLIIAFIFVGCANRDLYEKQLSDQREQILRLETMKKQQEDTFQKQKKLFSTMIFRLSHKSCESPERKLMKEHDTTSVSHPQICILDDDTGENICFDFI